MLDLFGDDDDADLESGTATDSAPQIDISGLYGESLDTDASVTVQPPTEPAPMAVNATLAPVSSSVSIWYVECKNIIINSGCRIRT